MLQTVLKAAQKSQLQGLVGLGPYMHQKKFLEVCEHKNVRKTSQKKRLNFGICGASGMFSNSGGGGGFGFKNCQFTCFGQCHAVFFV